SAASWATAALRASVPSRLADGDQGLSDAPRQETLETEERDQDVVELERARRNHRAPQHPSRDPPPRHAGQVEILGVRDPEPRVAQQAGQRTALVPAVVGPPPPPRAAGRRPRP